MTTDRIMLDSTNWRAILAAVKDGRHFMGLPVSLAAGYLDGARSAWPPEAWKELQAAGIDRHHLVGITVLGTGAEAFRARAGDSEPGDMDPAHAARWAQTEHQAGHWPVIYCDRNDKPRVIGECSKLGMSLHHDYLLWVATLDGGSSSSSGFTDLDGSDLRQQKGVAAIQYLGAKAAGIDADVSLVVDAGWRAVKSVVAQRSGYLVTAGAGGGYAGRPVTSVDGGKTWA
jgi:hypothetical protein